MTSSPSFRCCGRPICRSRFSSSTCSAESSFKSKKVEVDMEKIKKPDDQWIKERTYEQFYVTLKKGTESAFSGEYWDNHEKGLYCCRCCGNALFSSDTKL